MSHKKLLYKNIFLLLVLQGFNFLLPIITMPYLLQVLGKEKYGLIMFAQAFVMYFVIITDFGFGLYATKEVALIREDKSKLDYFYSVIMFIKSIMFVSSLIIASIIIFSFEMFQIDKIIYLTSFGILLGNVFFPVWLFLGLEKMKFITILNVIIKIVFTFSVFYFIKEEADYTLVPILQSLGFIITSLISLWIIHKHLKLKLVKPDISEAKRHFIASSKYFLSRASVSIYTTSNVFILGLMTNNIMVAYYSAAEKLFKAMQSIYSPIVNALLPNMAKNKDVSLFKQLLFIASLGNIIVCGALYYFAPYIMEFVFDEFTIESFQVFRILLVASIVIVPTILIGYPLLGALDHEDYANNSTIFGSIFHLLSLVTMYFMNLIDIYNLAMLVVITELIVFSIRVYGVNKFKLLRTKS